MSRILKVIVMGMYISVTVQFLRIFFIEEHEDIIEINYITRKPGTSKRLHREIRKNKRNATIMTQDFEKPLRLKTDLKYILEWTNKPSHRRKPKYKIGQQLFIENNCPIYNCYLSNDKSLLTDPRFFDAIIFDIENNWDLHPLLRAPHQKFIFTAFEEFANVPICHPGYDSYFNWTWSYRLDSDIKRTYYTINDMNGVVVGPKIDMTWIEFLNPSRKKNNDIFKSKYKTVAWILDKNCRSHNNRDNVFKNLTNALRKYGLTIDVYGSCGNISCPNNDIDECLKIVQSKYYFYLAFENTICEDCVAEGVLYQLLHYSVPVVYGGANYSRFLPPGSYLDAKVTDADTIALLMLRAVKNKTIYSNYFRWQNYYTYKKFENNDICFLCELLHKSTETSIVKNFRKWWNPDYEKMCSDIDLQENAVIL